MSATQSIRRTVKDIRPDLIERLEAANAEMATARTEYDVRRRELEQEFNKLFEEVSSKQRALGVLLDTEMIAFGAMERRRAPSAAAPMKLPLAEFIIHRVAAEGDNYKDDIRDSVERAGYVGVNETAGRMVHTTLLNLVRAGKLQQNGDQYSLPPLMMPVFRRAPRPMELEHPMEHEKKTRAEEIGVEEGSAAEAAEPSDIFK